VNSLYLVRDRGADVIARHARSWEKEDDTYDPLRSLALIEQKTNALDQAAPLADWELPEAFLILRHHPVLPRLDPTNLAGFYSAVDTSLAQQMTGQISPK